MIAIHDSPRGFHPRWIAYCEKQGIPFKRVNCHASDIIDQLGECQALMWHYGQSHPKDILVARQILSACEHAGLTVFPNFRTAWHFDDKVAQKYLFEALDIPAVPAHVFLDRKEALGWIDRVNFPKVFKLRRGAGSAGVKLVRTRREARKLVRRAFGRGFPVYDPWDNLKERIYKYRIGKFPISEIAKGIVRFAWPPRFSKILGQERGYVYFQDFLPDNDCDIRVIVVGDRAFGIRRDVRPGDFRASGSGIFKHARDDIDERCVDLAFGAAERLGGDSIALDFVYTQSREPRILEVSYGFVQEGYDPCEGYWDRGLNWHECAIHPQEWMVEDLLKTVRAGQEDVT